MTEPAPSGDHVLEIVTVHRVCVMADDYLDAIEKGWRYAKHLPGETTAVNVIRLPDPTEQDPDQ